MSIKTAPCLSVVDDTFLQHLEGALGANEQHTHKRSGRESASEASDEKVLDEIAKGDKEQLRVLFRRYGRNVFNVARRILNDDFEADDLVQEVFVYVFQKASSFDPSKGSAVSWIIQNAYHRAIDRRRFLGFRRHYEVLELRDETVPGRPICAVDHLMSRSLLEELRERISPEQRDVLELHLFDGYTFQEIASKSGQTYGNVRNHYYRGIQRLRSLVFREK